MAKTNLLNYLYEHTSEEADVKDSVFVDFISNKIDNGDLPIDVQLEDIEIPDEEVDKWMEEFNKFIQQGE